MNSSNGFGGSSVLGSTTGLKRRNLRPASGMLNKKHQFLRSVDVSLSEPAIATSLRSEIAAIEEEINLLDKDKKLRQSDGGLQKSYVGPLRKWLRDNHTISEKEDDDLKVLKQLGAQSYEKGFQKLWKIVCSLDLTITKITELQIVNFLIYDDMFDQIGKDTQRSTGLLSQISNNGYTPGTFQITQIILDRLKDVYAGCKKGQTKTSRQQMRMSDDKRAKQESNSLISQLKLQNNKLNSMLEQLIKEKDQEKVKASRREKQLDDKKEKNSSTNANSLEVKDQFKELQDKYHQQIKQLRDDKINAEYLVAELKTKISSLESQLKIASEAGSSKQVSAVKADSYQQVLMEQMEKMKKGFERKIAILTQDFTNRERNLRRKQIQFKTENQKLKWQRSLLLKKFEFLST